MGCIQEFYLYGSSHPSLTRVWDARTEEWPVTKRCVDLGAAGVFFLGSPEQELLPVSTVAHFVEDCLLLQY
jgi:hypothetical protein